MNPTYRPRLSRLTRNVAGVVLLLAVPAMAFWSWDMTTKETNHFYVAQTGERIHFRADTTDYYLLRPEAESLAHALLWAAGKEQSKMADDEAEFILRGKQRDACFEAASKCAAEKLEGK